MLFGPAERSMLSRSVMPIEPFSPVSTLSPVSTNIPPIAAGYNPKGAGEIKEKINVTTIYNTYNVAAGYGLIINEYRVKDSKYSITLELGRRPGA